jgi:hypothetical protein
MSLLLEPMDPASSRTMFDDKPYVVRVPEVEGAGAAEVGDGSDAGEDVVFSVGALCDPSERVEI